jgi:hypothetical protein
MLYGDGFWSDFADGFRKGFKAVADIGVPIVGTIPGLRALPIAYEGAKRLGFGRPALCGAVTQAGRRCRRLRGSCPYHY